MSARNYDHLLAAIQLPDAEFDAFWAHFQAARPDLGAGASITLTREQLQRLQRVAFAAGREAAINEITSALGVAD